MPKAKRDRRTVERCRIRVCPYGHATPEGPLEMAEQIKCPLGHWTWEDGNFCISCGTALPRDARQTRLLGRAGQGRRPRR